MLYSAIGDMENLIKDLKLKVSKAESRADCAEEKCITLSESNEELNEELNFLKGRLDCLEASLYQAKEMKKATAKDIGIRTKVITDLVMQLAIERERLHKQVLAYYDLSFSLKAGFGCKQSQFYCLFSLYHLNLSST
jgi:predicted  nucleic acid-binding Zn-ribbon protein